MEIREHLVRFQAPVREFIVRVTGGKAKIHTVAVFSSSTSKIRVRGEAGPESTLHGQDSWGLNTTETAVDVASQHAEGALLPVEKLVVIA